MERGRQATLCDNERGEKLDRSTITSNGEWSCVDVYGPRLIATVC